MMHLQGTLGNFWHVTTSRQLEPDSYHSCLSVIFDLLLGFYDLRLSASPPYFYGQTQGNIIAY